VSVLNSVIRRENLVWTKNGTTISSGLFDNNNRLTIGSAQKSDAGIYEVFVSVPFIMQLRTKTTTITLQVYGRFYQYVNLIYALC